MQQQTGKRLGFAAIAAFLVIALLVLLLPIVLIPAHERSDWFWWRIAWTEFLVAFLWSTKAALTIFPSQAPAKARSAWGGVLPSIYFAAITYCFCSFLLLVGRAWLPDASWLDRTHMTLQLVLAALTSLAIISLVAAKLLASPATRAALPQQPPDPRFLATLLQKEEERFVAAPKTDGSLETANDEIYQKIRRLKEILQYSLPPDISSRGSTAYGTLSRLIEEIARDSADATIPNRNTPDIFAANIDNAIRQAGMVVQEQIST